MSRTILVTGAAGFIGSHIVQALATRGDRVVGLDNLNDYYDPARKRANLDEVRQALRQSGSGEAFTFIQGDIRHRQTVEEIFSSHAIDGIVHLAAMAGVRVSIENPHLYCDVNINGTLNLLDAAVGMGIPREPARLMVAQTVAGAARLAAESGESPARLREMVTSRGGTTERALETLEARGFGPMMAMAVQAAYERAKELGGRS